MCKRLSLLMTLCALAAPCVAAAPENRWLRVRHSSYAIEMRFVGYYGNLYGSYFRPFPRSHPGVAEAPPMFTAECYDGPPQEFTTEAEARAFVLACARY